jgi:hypothetical protein
MVLFVLVVLLQPKRPSLLKHALCTGIQTLCFIWRRPLHDTDSADRAAWLWQVVRCFEDENVVHVAGKVDPVEDTDVINFELAISDITQIEKRLERLKKGRAKTKEEEAKFEVGLCRPVY